MFDWIGDAIDWIGDGISSLWDSTIGGATEAIGDWIWECMFEWLFNLIFGAVSELFEFINESAADIFDMAWAGAFLSLFHHLAWMLFICGMVVAIFDTAISYESGQANIKNTCLNVLKGFMAANLVTVVPQRLYSFCTDLQGTFATDLLHSGMGNNVAALEHAKRASALEPGNVDYQNLVRRFESGGSWYEQRQASYGYPSFGSSDICMKICIANMICNFCCGGGMCCGGGYL